MGSRPRHGTGITSEIGSLTQTVRLVANCIAGVYPPIAVHLSHRSPVAEIEEVREEGERSQLIHKVR